jgi:hypothetical protein
VLTSYETIFSYLKFWVLWHIKICSQLCNQSNFLILSFVKMMPTWAWWLIPITLTTQEAEIRRITAWSQTGQTVPWDPISKKPFIKKGWWIDSRCRPWVQAPVLEKKKRMHKMLKISFYFFHRHIFSKSGVHILFKTRFY